MILVLLLSFFQMMCKIYYYVWNFSYTASIVILMVIAGERYIAIIFPLKARLLLTLRKLTVVQVIIWIIACVYNIPYLIYYDTVEFPFVGVEFCYFAKEHLIAMKKFSIANLVVWYILPLGVMALLYFKIGKTLWKTTVSSARGLQSRTDSRNSSIRSCLTNSISQSLAHSESNSRLGHQSQNDSRNNSVRSCLTESMSKALTHPGSNKKLRLQSQKDSRNSSTRSCVTKLESLSESYSKTNNRLGLQSQNDSRNSLIRSCLTKSISQSVLYSKTNGQWGLQSQKGSKNGSIHSSLTKSLSQSLSRSASNSSLRLQSQKGQINRSTRSCSTKSMPQSLLGSESNIRLGLQSQKDSRNNSICSCLRKLEYQSESHSESKNRLVLQRNPDSKNSTIYKCMTKSKSQSLLHSESNKRLNGSQEQIEERGSDNDCRTSGEVKSVQSKGRGILMISNDLQTEPSSPQEVQFYLTDPPERQASVDENLHRHQDQQSCPDRQSEVSNNRPSTRYKVTNLKKSRKLVQARKEVIRLLAAIVVLFAVCVLPHHLKVLNHYWMFCSLPPSVDVYISPCSFILLYLNSALNPVFYALFSKNFRYSFKDSLTCFKS